MGDHDRALAEAFDRQAARFERAPVQSDPDALARLVLRAEFPAGGRVLDAGCGPGLVAEAMLEAGLDVVGVDLSPEMVARARSRCDRFGDRARFVLGSLHEADLAGLFDGAISRFVLHHVVEPDAFLRRQVDLLRPGGVVVLCDHTTDPDPDRAAWHNAIERARDRTHTANLPPGMIVDRFALRGLGSIRLEEEPFALDFDEWFDRGTPTLPKAEVRCRLLAGPPARGFQAVEEQTGAVRIECWRAIVRGVKP